MRVLIYGAKGWIGGQMIALLAASGISYVEGRARANDAAAVAAEMDGFLPAPTHVISLLGRTHGEGYTTIDYLEQPGKLRENLRDNLQAPLVLAAACRERNMHFTYLGTGCIFAYEDVSRPEETAAFGENATPNFFGSSYSMVKGATDMLMAALFGETALNLRIRMPITGEPNGRNFITKIVGYKRICSVPNSMSVLPDLLPLVVDMMRRSVVGTMNLTNPGVITHNEILEMYREIVDPTFQWVNFTVEEQRAILAADRSNNRLDTARLETMYPQVKPIREAVRECLVSYAAAMGVSVQPVQSVHLLITGGCGFIGSNFINYYFPKGKVQKLVNLDAMYYCARRENVDEVIRNDTERYQLVEGNLCDADLVSHILQAYDITHVIHFAAQSHVQNSFEDSLTFTRDNVLGTHVLLECVRKYGRVRKFIHVSTDEVYGESMNTVDEQCKTEHSVLCPTNPYAATKAGAELIAQSYHHSYKMPIIITRGNNVYGPNQYPEKLIPRFLKLLREDKPVTIQGEGKTVRAFLHARDTARAFECILEKGRIGEIYNIGCDEGMEYSVMEIADILIDMVKGTRSSEERERWKEYVADRPFNDRRYYISNQKLRDLGWTIEVSLMDGLRTL